MVSVRITCGKGVVSDRCDRIRYEYIIEYMIGKWRGTFMKNRKKSAVLALLLAGSVAMLGGCSKLKKEEPQTEKPTEVVTEAPTESETATEKPTEKVTEKQTETEKVTEKQTELKVLTAEEEKAQEKELDQIKMMYAKDDINVRSDPDTTADNIVYSYMQGDQVTVVGETPNWYVVEMDGYDFNGYVSKQFVSAEKVAEKTDAERQEAIEKELSTTQTSDSATTGTTSEGTSSDTTGSSSDTTAVDSQYGVGDFAESYSVEAATGANIRSTPAQDGEIVGTIESGTKVTALGETDRWYKIEYNGTVGYVNKNLFK